LISCSFSSAQDNRETVDFSLCGLKRQGHAGLDRASPTCRLQAFSRRSGCVPAEPYPPLKQPPDYQSVVRWQQGQSIILLLIAQTCLLLIAPRQPRPEAAAVGERWPTAHGLQQMPVVCACRDICRDDLWFEIELAALKSDGR
jgi:hypothetical protein